MNEGVPGWKSGFCSSGLHGTAGQRRNVQLEGVSFACALRLLLQSGTCGIPFFADLLLGDHSCH
jgi:hypothetical protein